VIKLLRGIFITTSVPAIQIDICCRMVQMHDDTDDNVKVSHIMDHSTILSIQELATKALVEMLYPPVAKPDSESRLVAVISDFNDSPTLLENAIQAVSDSGAIKKQACS
jgi:hypothetical protein